MKPLICKSLVPVLYSFLLLCSLQLHTPTQAARKLLPSPRVASTSLPLSSSYRVDLVHLPQIARKLPETASSTSSSLRRIPRSGPNPTQNKMKPKFRS